MAKSLSGFFTNVLYIFIIDAFDSLKSQYWTNMKNVSDKDSVVYEDMTIDEVNIIDEDSVSNESSVSYKHIKSDEV